MSDYGFKFSVGQLVTHVGFDPRSRHRGMVIERGLQECSGGIQRHYLVRMFFVDRRCNASGWSLHKDSSSFKLDVCKVNEIELQEAAPIEDEVEEEKNG